MLATALLAGAAIVILSAVASCFRAANEIRMESLAADLAVTRLSEIQMGLAELASDGPREYEDPGLEGWTWQIIVDDAPGPLDQAPLTRVEIVIVNTTEGYTHRLRGLVQPPRAPDYEFDEYDDLSMAVGVGGERP